MSHQPLDLESKASAARPVVVPFRSLVAETATVARLNVHPKRLFRTLMLIAAGLTVVSFVGEWVRYLFQASHRALPAGLQRLIELFDVGLESNLPTWYSTVLLVLGAALLLLIARHPSTRDYRRHWRALGLIFVGLSIDEASAIHDSATTLLRNTLHTSGFLYLAWVIPALLFVGLFVVLYIPFIRALPAPTRHVFLLAGAVYVTGAVGFEMLGAFFGERVGWGGLTFAVIWTVEEFAEMVGVAIFIYGVLNYLASLVPVALIVAPETSVEPGVGAPTDVNNSQVLPPPQRPA